MTKDPDTHLREQIALFRHGLVSQLLALDARSAERGERMAALSTQDHLIPGSGRVRIAQNTLRDWMRAYTRGGFAALIPRPRADRDHSRRIGPHLAEQLIAMKQANPKLSVRLIIEALCEQGAFQTEPVPPVSTAHRLLHKAGVMRRAPDEPNPADRRRFAFERAGQLWTSDVLHGPGVLVAGLGLGGLLALALNARGYAAVAFDPFFSTAGRWPPSRQGRCSKCLKISRLVSIFPGILCCTAATRG